MKIEPIVQNSLVDTVGDRIRRVIEQGNLKSGDRLPSESELVKHLGVSRPVVREAVRRLESIGLLTIQRGRGMFVGNRQSLRNCVQLFRSAMSISPKEVLQFAEFRRAIECYAARRAAEVASDKDIEELETLRQQIDREGQDYLAAIQFDFRFHLKLVATTGNELMLHIMEVIQEFVMAGMMKVMPKPRDRERSRRAHAAILEAIRARDPEAAENAMKAHMDAVSTRLQQLDKQTESIPEAG